MLELPTPYLAFLGDARDPLDIKTARGVRDWAPERLVGQWSLDGCTLSLDLPPMTPAMARQAGARSLLIGVAPFGGQIPPGWIPALCMAMDAGLAVVSGLHQRLGSIPELAAAADRNDVALVDVRHGTPLTAVATGRRRSGRRLLTVGTDCALGKKYTALALAKAMAARGMDCDFRATGQTGILIAGAGIAIDAVVADFVAGAAEQLSPDAQAAHWDLIEGQGSLFHPAYAGVSLGLLHGSQPDLFVLCHDPARLHVDGYPDHPLPELEEAIDLHLRLGRRTNPDLRCLGISLNTSGLAEGERDAALAGTAARLGLPCVDPLRTGVDALVDALQDESAGGAA
ncbi:MAG TPA: DUF1611 domain-containing protein, partial [Pseudomonadales bacterium]|nr:DUF1611 domain-containing protein [Pseudomonadales bacterium]